MGISEGFIVELQREAATTRKILERIPAEKFDWKPHEKSMTMQRLATHVADMFNWLPMTLATDELDFAKGYDQPKPETTEELVALFDKNVAAGEKSLREMDESGYLKPWTLRNGEQVLLQMPKIGVLRGMVLNHIIHHRGQLSIYLRMNDIPVPALYGPSADEQ